MCLLPLLQMLVGIFDHDDSRIEHCTDRDRDAAERHDVGVDTLVAHDDEGHQHAQRQRNDRDQGRAKVKEKRHAHERNDDEFLDQFLPQVVDRPLDEAGAVVGRHDLHARRQARLERLELRLDGLDCLQRVLPGAHDDHATGHLAFAVKLRDAAPHLRAHLDRRHVAQTHRDAGGGCRQRDLAEVVQPLQITGDAHHVFGLGEFQHRPSAFPVGLLHRVDGLGERDSVGAQPIGVDHDLVLAHHPADACDLRDVGHGLQLVLQEPVL